MRYLLIKPNSRVNHGNVRIHAIAEGEYDSRPGTDPYTSVALCGTVWKYGTSKWVRVGAYKQPATITKKITCLRCLRSFNKAAKERKNP